MSQDKTKRPVLVVSDSADELRAVRELLQVDGHELFSAATEEAGIRLFQERKPALLVLVFQELQLSERFYLMLYRQCATIQEIAHQTLLLCKSNEAEAAFALCRNGTLDDYVVNRPMHDPLRLRLAALQALARLDGRAQSATVNRQLSHIGSDLRHLDSFVSQALTGGQARQAEALAAFREFAGRLGRELDQFESRMSDPALGEAASAIERSGLRQQFDQMRQARVEPETRQVEAKLNAAQKWTQDFDAGYREQAARVTAHEFPPGPVEVMLIDDDDVYREMLGAMLEEVEMRVVLADNAETGLAEMRKKRPDIVLLDYNMPGLDGMAALRRMKADPQLAGIPVVMLTGITARETVKEVITGGAAGYIVKPSNRPTILAKLRNVLPKAP